MKKRVLFVVVVALVLMSFVIGRAIAAVTEYTVPAVADFSGSQVEFSKMMVPLQKAVFSWWNDRTGKELGVKLNLKPFDGRYDSSVIASMWPGILEECKPIIALGFGGADAAALQQRLPKDKVPMLWGGGSYGFAWLPNQWIFNMRPLWVQEYLAGINWYIEQHPEKRPLRFAFMPVNVAASMDVVRGLKKYFKDVLEPKGLATIVAEEYVDMNAVDVSTQMKKLIDAKADLVNGPITSGMTSTYLRACQLYGVNIPTIASPHHTIWSFATAMGTFEPLEGHIVSAAHASVTDKSSQAYKFFELLSKNYGVAKNLYNPMSMLGFCQSIVAVRAVERAAKKVGAKKITGQSVYDAMLSDAFTHGDLMGLLPTITFTRDAPFPSGRGLKAVVETVKNGKYVLATPEWVPVPEVTKW
jgi:branched-chain amino acid transport system substrate-binding protein